MAYEPLHHKYRPQTLAELVGQEAITTTLTNALHQQKIAPAYLFTGARGTGKTSSARILAKSLNCLKAGQPTAAPCGLCEVCRTITNGSALDIIEIDAASNTGVDNIRELIERAQFAPVQCRYKVYVIDECHMLSTQAFNALLKTLEEPPDRVVFVLATTDPQRVLPTIISRCQRFDFRRIELGAMTRHLIKIADQEAIDINPEAVQLVAQLAQGGLRDAESTLDQLSLLEGQIVPERVWDLVGAVPERDLLALVQTLATGDSTGVIDGLRALMDRGREPLIVLQNLASFYRDLLIAKTTPERRDLVAVTAPTWAEMVSFVQCLSVSSLLRGQQQLRASEIQIKNTTQPRLWLEVTLLGLLSPEAPTQAVPPVSMPPISMPPISMPVVQPMTPSIKAPAIAPAIPKTPLAAPPEILPPPPAPSDHAVAAPKAPIEIPVIPPVPIEAPAAALAEPNLEQVWQSILGLLQPLGTQALFKQQGRLLALQPEMARIGITSQPLFKMAQLRVANLELAFAQLVEHPVKVSLEVVAVLETSPAASPAEHPAPSAEDKPRSAFANHSNGAVSEAATAYRPSEPPRPKPSSQPQHPASNQPQEIPSSATPQWQAEDEVSRAAKSFAQMFNGQIVSGAEPDLAPSEAIILEPSVEPVEPEPGDPDDDVPF
jgi:DNA polymerase III subunit gamma/tau